MKTTRRKTTTTKRTTPTTKARYAAAASNAIRNIQRRTMAGTWVRAGESMRARQNSVGRSCGAFIMVSRFIDPVVSNAATPHRQPDGSAAVQFTNANQQGGQRGRWRR